MSIRGKRLIAHVFSLFIIPSAFLHSARTKAVLTGLKLYQPQFMAPVTILENGEKTLKF